MKDNVEASLRGFVWSIKSLQIDYDVVAFHFVIALIKMNLGCTFLRKI